MSRRPVEEITYSDVLRELLELRKPAKTAQAAVNGGPWVVSDTSFPAGTQFMADYKGTSYTGIVKDGKLELSDGSKFTTPSGAAVHITGSNVNGSARGRRPEASFREGPPGHHLRNWQSFPVSAHLPWVTTPTNRERNESRARAKRINRGLFPQQSAGRYVHRNREPRFMPSRSPPRFAALFARRRSRGRLLPTQLWLHVQSVFAPSTRVHAT
jgi:hypothetical protein